MGFKLLAIRPLLGCNPKFRKNLNENSIYKFYNDYIFELDANNEEVTNIKSLNTVPTNLFGENINVSAIVGENGSGKSALIELFVASINQFSFYLKNNDKVQIQTDANLESIAPYIQGETINVEIFFEEGNNKFRLTINNNNFSALYNFTTGKKVEKEKLKSFFYTLIINYSLYSFNPYVLGRGTGFNSSNNHWIDGLFHKNDSYQIPIVINPKRENANSKFGGVIDINNEQKLLQQRILYNLLKFYDNN